MIEFEEIRIENTNRCLMNCITCPRDRMTRDKGCMTYEGLVYICEKMSSYLSSSKLRWMDLHGYGEPLLDKSLPKKIKYIKTHFPNVNTRIVTTLFNAKQETIESLLESGLTEIVISHYASSEEMFRKIHRVSGFDKTRNSISCLIRMNRTKTPRLRLLIENIDFSGVLEKNEEMERRKKLDVWYKNIIKMGCDIRELTTPHNWGSAFRYKNKSSSICSVVNGYRKRVLQITWDGNVIPCCFDYNADIVFGNIFNDNIEHIFSSATYKSFILNHLKGRIECYSPCKECNKCVLP